MESLAHVSLPLLDEEEGRTGVRLDVGMAQAIGHDKSYHLLVTLIRKMGSSVDCDVNFA
jgi:hypothetical protein